MSTADDRGQRGVLTPEQETALDLCRQAITGEARSMRIQIDGHDYEVPCVIGRLVLENGQVEAKFQPVSAVWKISGR